MLIERKLQPLIQTKLQKEPSVILLYGPRQAGKTTLLQNLLHNIPKEQVIFFNGDDVRTEEVLGTPNFDALKRAIGTRKYVVIDEAQRIKDIGLSIKLLFDNLKIPIIASGSSSFELANRVSEPLTGRATTFFLYPIAIGELLPKLPDLTLAPRLEEFLRFGMYPKVVTTEGAEDKERYLYDLVNLYLYKDILAFETVRKPKKVLDLLTLLALQIGSEVSIAELSKHVALSKQIVEKYLDILEKMFVIVNVRGFSRNLRKEVYKTSKYYFFDTGLRNALIRNFNPLHLRTDTGALFENFFLIERMKAVSNRGGFARFYFWRTYDQKEIDIIEERDGNLYAYEIKWKEENIKPPLDWRRQYPNATFSLVASNNYTDFLST